MAILGTSEIIINELERENRKLKAEIERLQKQATEMEYIKNGEKQRCLSITEPSNLQQLLD